jgi:ABC-type transport system involved in multi-copper enzyme maturation permease subunit
MSDKSLDVPFQNLSNPPSIAEATEMAGLAPRGPSAIRTLVLMAQITFREAARRRILWIAMVVAFLILAFWATALHQVLRNMALHRNVTLVLQRENLTVMTIMMLYADTMMTSLMAALTSCETISGEISSGTIHAIATKPVPRWTLILGKWIGFVLMISFYILLVEGGTIAIAWTESHYLLAHWGAALGFIWLQAILLMTVTLAASTCFSALTSGTISIGLYGVAFVGGWIETVGVLQHVRTCVDLGIVASLIMPSDALWRRAAAVLKPPLLGTIGATPFHPAVTPSMAMIFYAVGYALAALLLAQWLFTRRDL